MHFEWNIHPIRQNNYNTLRLQDKYKTSICYVYSSICYSYSSKSYSYSSICYKH